MVVYVQDLAMAKGIPPMKKTVPPLPATGARVIRHAQLLLRQDAQNLLMNAQEEARGIVEHGRQCAVAEQTQAYQEGLAQGLAEGHARAAADLECALRRHHDAIQKIEEQMASMVCDTMEKIFFLTDAQQRVQALVRHALTTLNVRCAQLQLYVHPDQMESMRTMLLERSQEFSLLRCTLLSDPALAAEAYRIEGEGWRADGAAATVFAQMRVVTQRPPC